MKSKKNFVCALCDEMIHYLENKVGALDFANAYPVFSLNNTILNFAQK
jgi:hypothetical protein